MGFSEEVRRASGEASSRTMNFSTQAGAMLVVLWIEGLGGLDKDLGC